MLTREFFKNKRVTVFGLGVNGGGVGTVKFLAKCGVKEIIVTDIKKRSELEFSLAQLKGCKGVRYVLGQHHPEDFIRTDMVIVNPGISWKNEYVQMAIKQGIPVEMDASIFMQLCEVPVIGVTGTKGKTTTATLIAEIFKKSGVSTVCAGIGQTPVLSALDEIKNKSVVVFEFSSWRLSSLRKIQKSPHIAVFTNIFPDHLNYYKNMEDYIRDKKNIFAFQTAHDWLIYNQENPETAVLAQEAVSQTIGFSESGPMGDGGVFVRDGVIWAYIGGSEKKIADLAEVKLRGKHNVANVLAGVGAALAYGIDAKSIRKVLATFTGVEHRLEYVREYQGVMYYNDTAATMPEAAVSALRSFEAPIVLIAGGNNKGLDFHGLAEEINQRTKGVVFLKGDASDAIVAILRKRFPERWAGKDIVMAVSMEQAVSFAQETSEPGDIVLLSPGATSFGLFQNEFDRGEQFKKTVKSL